jgi:sugar lactone lactonase YvrE
MVVGGVAALCAMPAAAQSIYFTELLDVGEGAIRRIQTDGTDLQTLSSAVGDGLRGIAADPPRGRVYWSDVDSGEIFRGPIDSPGNGEVIVSGLAFPVDIGVDSERRRLAWVGAGSDETLQASNLDGGDRVVLVSDVSSGALAMDELSGYVYFEDRTTSSRGAIKRIKLDGSGLETIVDDVPTATDLAIDPIQGYVYWGSSAGFDNTGGIYRVRFDGTGFEEVFKSDVRLLDATALTLDPEGGSVYFSLLDTANDCDLYRMGLDGSDPTLIAAGFDSIVHMDFVVPSPSGLAALAAAAVLGSRRRR